MKKEIIVNITDYNTKVGNIGSIIDELTKFKKKCIIEQVPYGEKNAKTAHEILGKDYGYLSSCLFCNYGRQQAIYLFDDTNFEVRRKLKVIEKTFVNIDNPNEVIKQKREVYVYWKE